MKLLSPFYKIRGALAAWRDADPRQAGRLGTVLKFFAVMLVLTREFAISGLRMVAASKGTVMAAAWSGKIKTACTMVGIILMLIFPNATLRLVCVAVILVTTIYSGIEYFVKNWKCLGL